MTELDDDTLIALIKKGDTHAEALLCSKYWTFARNLGKKHAVLYPDVGLTADDFAAVAFSSLVVAIKKYSFKSNRSFKKYWLAIAKNQCINYMRDNAFIDDDVLKPLSFDSVPYEGALSLHETWGEQDDNIKYFITTKQLCDYIISDEAKLTEIEQVVAYYMFIENYGYKDLEQLTKWSREKIYSAAKRARKKVSNFIKSGYFN